jgi:hypothetical protein
MPMPQYLKDEPVAVPLDVEGPFIRMGQQTYIHYEMIAGFRTVEVPIWGGPPAPDPVEDDGDDDEEEVEVVLVEDSPEGKAEAKAEAKAAEMAAAKSRVEAARAVMDANAKSLAEAPRIGMVQVYLHNRYGSLMVDSTDGSYTSTPLIRHSVSDLMAAIEVAATNRARGEAKIMSGMIAREIGSDLGEQVEDTTRTLDDRI